MKSRIVLWGTQGEKEKVLIGIELVALENKVLLHVVPEAAATETFYNLLMNEWREGREVEWPAAENTIERPLTASDSILPEDIKVQRTDVVQRAQSEWHFVVLSAKLKDVYDSEIRDIKEKVQEMTQFDGGVWEELKGFWGKVQEQIRDKNLFRSHANNIKKEVNELFDELKTMRSSLDAELKTKSEEIYKEFSERLDVVEEKIEKGLGLQPLFNDLKDIQKKFRDSDLIRKHQNKLWKRIDNAFKAVKSKRFGSENDSGGRLGRLQSRYDGLSKAINRMRSSIGKDKKDIEWEESRIGKTDGQLEAQLRTAKLKMIQERISSKQVKLDDMLKTEGQLKAQIEKEMAREEERKRVEQAKAEAKEKIQEKVAANKEKMAAADDKLSEAAEKIMEGKKKTESTTEAPAVEKKEGSQDEGGLMDRVVADLGGLDKVLR